MVFRRYGTLNSATIPLTDGQTPPGDTLSVTDFLAQLSWYGSFVTITDKVQYVVQDRVLNESTKVLSLQLGLTIDTLIRHMMVSTSSTISCQFGANGRDVAVVKSLLIDLEFVTDHADDDKAQAA